jgi:hypothetical protein
MKLTALALTCSIGLSFGLSIGLSAGLSAAPFAAMASTTTPPAAKSTADTEIRAVIETFRTSIINKDKTRFLQLFHGKSIPWLAVLDDESLQLAKKRNPKASKADPMGTPGPVPFIKSIASDSSRAEEKFENIRIETDGDIASVYFDYSFHQDNYKSNWGKEAWHLVRTDQGWKINSVIYSVHINPVPPPKQP